MTRSIFYQNNKYIYYDHNHKQIILVLSFLIFSLLFLFDLPFCLINGLLYLSFSDLFFILKSGITILWFNLLYSKFWACILEYHFWYYWDWIYGRKFHIDYFTELMAYNCPWIWEFGYMYTTYWYESRFWPPSQWYTYLPMLIFKAIFYWNIMLDWVIYEWSLKSFMGGWTWECFFGNDFSIFKQALFSLPPGSSYVFSMILQNDLLILGRFIIYVPMQFILAGPIWSTTLLITLTFIYFNIYNIIIIFFNDYININRLMYYLCSLIIVLLILLTF